MCESSQRLLAVSESPLACAFAAQLVQAAAAAQGVAWLRKKEKEKSELKRKQVERSKSKAKQV